MGGDKYPLLISLAAVREFVGLLTGHKKKQTAIFITMLATYILLAIICF